jgi:integrase/recombinase XerD
MASTRNAQPIESTWKSSGYNVSHKVAGNFARRDGQEGGLYGPGGERKYLNRDERHRVLAAAESFEPERALFALVLAWTGARISEVLALTPASFQIDTGVVTVVTLKRRKYSIREVPIPPQLVAQLERHFDLTRLQRGKYSAQRRLWCWHRVTAWRLIKWVMMLAQVNGRPACPRGLRHGFGVGTLQSGVPLHLIQRWMGHARLSTTAMYMNVCGPEEIAFAARFWNNDLARRAQPPALAPAGALFAYDGSPGAR